MNEESAIEARAASLGFETVLLICPRQQGLATAGALTLEGAMELSPEFYACVRTVSHALIDAGDVQPSFR